MKPSLSKRIIETLQSSFLSRKPQKGESTMPNPYSFPPQKKEMTSTEEHPDKETSITENSATSTTEETEKNAPIDEVNSSHQTNETAATKESVKQNAAQEEPLPQGDSNVDFPEGKTTSDNNILKITTIRNITTQAEEENNPTTTDHVPAEKETEQPASQEVLPQSRASNADLPSEKEQLIARLKELEEREAKQKANEEEYKELVLLAQKLELPAMADQIIKNFTAINTLESNQDTMEKEVASIIKQLTDEIASIKQTIASQPQAQPTPSPVPSPASSLAKQIDQLHKLQELTAYILDLTGNGDMRAAILGIKKQATEMNQILDMLVKGAK